MGSFENLNTEFVDNKVKDKEEEEVKVKTSPLNLNATPLNLKTSSFAQGG